MNFKALITGGAGFIGSHIAEGLNGKAGISIIDNLRTGNLNNINGIDAHFIEADIRDRIAVRKAMNGVDVVFHLAAQVSVPESIINPQESIEINTIGTVILLEEAVRAKVKKFCFSSSCAVYGDSQNSPNMEECSLSPKSPYAVTKLDGEYYCQIFSETTDLKTVSLRYFNVFGERQSPVGSYAAAVPIFIRNAINNEEIIIHGTGEQTRDFIYVKDVAKANIFFSQNELGGIFNIGYGSMTSINSMAKSIIDTTNSKSKIRYEESRKGDIFNSSASIKKLASSGFKFDHDVGSGLKRAIAVYSCTQPFDS